MSVPGCRCGTHSVAARRIYESACRRTASPRSNGLNLPNQGENCLGLVDSTSLLHEFGTRLQRFHADRTRRWCWRGWRVWRRCRFRDGCDLAAAFRRSGLLCRLALFLRPNVSDILVFDAVFFQSGNDFRVPSLGMSLNVATDSLAFAHSGRIRIRRRSSVVAGIGNGAFRGGSVDQIGLGRIHERSLLAIFGQIRTSH
ncbi:hypothetical protein RB10563 [Rhodopirellula baltica SH 1]|uniref:Uncharacterized protein n=1 Tax=Rhodopirellula baltica (strain DSM 10527 / NCIMB 13988 / SH1) TaxID=243090 RepID=Q7UET8_RHOBA|nr:hypothetical protein RB10563 [Rhodopirellula baltica SH 1]